MLVVRLNDGETYTSIEGCTIIAVPSSVEDVDQYVKDSTGMLDVSTLAHRYLGQEAWNQVTRG